MQLKPQTSDWTESQHEAVTYEKIDPIITNIVPSEPSLLSKCMSSVKELATNVKWKPVLVWGTLVIFFFLVLWWFYKRFRKKHLDILEDEE